MRNASRIVLLAGLGGRGAITSIASRRAPRSWFHVTAGVGALGATFPVPQLGPVCQTGISGDGEAMSRWTGARRGTIGDKTWRWRGLVRFCARASLARQCRERRWRRAIPAIPTGSSAALGGSSSASANLIIVTNELRHGFISSLIKQLC